MGFTLSSNITEELLNIIQVDSRDQIIENYTLIGKKLNELFPTELEPKNLYTAANHLLGRGKMLRPLLILLVNQNLGSKNINKIIKLSMAVELLHTASVIHDDIIDEADYRRGLPSIHKKFGNETAIVTGDLLISMAIKITSDLDPLTIRWVSEAAINMSEGESFEIEYKNQDLNTEMYYNIIKKKTASLIESSVASSALLSGVSNKLIDSFRTYGLNVGLGFQIRDDILDIIGKEQTLGKPVGNDIKSGRHNIVHILTKQTYPESRNLPGQKINNYVTPEIIESAQKLASHHSNLAKASVSTFNEESKSIFESIASFIVNRNF